MPWGGWCKAGLARGMLDWIRRSALLTVQSLHSSNRNTISACVWVDMLPHVVALCRRVAPRAAASAALCRATSRWAAPPTGSPSGGSVGLASHPFACLHWLCCARAWYTRFFHVSCVNARLQLPCARLWLSTWCHSRTADTLAVAPLLLWFPSLLCQPDCLMGLNCRVQHPCQSRSVPM